MASVEKDVYGDLVVELSVAEIDYLLAASREHGIASIQNLPVAGDDRGADLDDPGQRLSLIVRLEAEQTD